MPTADGENWNPVREGFLQQAGFHFVALVIGVVGFRRRLLAVTRGVDVRAAGKHEAVQRFHWGRSVERNAKGFDAHLAQSLFVGAQLGFVSKGDSGFHSISG